MHTYSQIVISIELFLRVFDHCPHSTPAVMTGASVSLAPRVALLANPLKSAVAVAAVLGLGFAKMPVKQASATRGARQFGAANQVQLAVGIPLQALSLIMLLLWI